MNRPKYTIWSKYHKGTYNFYDCYSVRHLKNTMDFLKITSTKKSEKFGYFKNQYDFNILNYVIAV